MVKKNDTKKFILEKKFKNVKKNPKNKKLKPFNVNKIPDSIMTRSKYKSITEKNVNKNQTLINKKVKTIPQNKSHPLQKICKKVLKNKKMTQKLVEDQNLEMEDQNSVVDIQVKDQNLEEEDQNLEEDDQNLDLDKILKNIITNYRKTKGNNLIKTRC